MRKLTVELKVREEFLEMLNFLLEKTESIELIELIKLDFKKGVKMGIAALTMKEGYTIEDIDTPKYMEYLTVLKQEGNRYIVVAKVKFFKRFIGLAKKFGIDIIWDTPSIFNRDKMTLSVTGNDENLKKFLELIKFIGEIKRSRKTLVSTPGLGESYTLESAIGKGSALVDDSSVVHMDFFIGKKKKKKKKNKSYSSMSFDARQEQRLEFE